MDETPTDRGYCSNCQHWDPTLNGYGHCRKLTPFAGNLSPKPFVHRDQPDAIWPITTGTDWCGEWKASAAQAPTVRPDDD